MRHTLLVILFSAALSAWGQDSTLHWLISGELVASGEQVVDETLVSAEGGTTMGYFVHPGWMTGVRFNGTWNPLSHFYDLGPEVRYYHSFGSHHALYLGGYAAYGWGSDQSIVTQVRTGRDAWTTGGRFGYLSRFNKYVALDVFTFYQRRSTSAETPRGNWTDRNTVQRFGLGVGIQIFL